MQIVHRAMGFWKRRPRPRYALALAGSLLAGSAMAASKSRSLLHMIGYPFVLAVAVYVIIDIEFPRLGFIRVDAFDQALVELRQSMNEAK